MSAAVDIYVPSQWNTSVSNVLAAAGFHVSSRDRKLGSGTIGREYSCTRKRMTIILTEVSMPNDPFWHFILGVSKPKHAATLLSACDALMQHGALDAVAYHRRNNA
jgi:hypothetical protein